MKEETGEIRTAPERLRRYWDLSSVQRRAYHALRKGRYGIDEAYKTVTSFKPVPMV